MKKKISISDILKGDFALWMVFLFLTAVSLISVYSSIGRYAILDNYTTPERQFFKHAIFVLGSYVIVWVCSNIKYQVFKLFSILLYLVGIGTSVVVLAMGSRWMTIAGISFQPSELLKLGTIMILALTMSIYRNKIGETKLTVFWLVIILFSVMMIFAQNLSTAALLMISGLFMILYSGMDSKIWNWVFFVSLAVGILGLTFFYFFGDDIEMFRSATWSSRIRNWLHPDINIFSQENTAKMAIARGGLIGAGIGNTIYARLMTQACNDFIFAIIIEESGAIMGFMVLAAYVVMFRRCILIVNKCNDVYGATLVAGIGILIFLQALVNICVAVGVLPVTGQTLPFVSYGGSSYLVLSLGLGIIQSVAHANNIRIKKEKKNETECTVA